MKGWTFYGNYLPPTAPPALQITVQQLAELILRSATQTVVTYGAYEDPI